MTALVRHVVAVAAGCAVLSGCAAASVPGPTSSPEPVTTPSATGPAPDAIRSLDPASLDWLWFDSFARIEPVEPGRPDEQGRTYQVGDPVYSDADGDGLEDMAVPIAQRDGNGFREQWHVWLADAAGGAVQVQTPIAWTSRCGDLARSVKAVDGGFSVHEFLREPLIDDALPCSSRGTFEIRRGVGVLRAADQLLLVDLADPRGYGGVCPAHPRTETRPVTTWGSLAPSLTAPLTIEGEKLNLMVTHPHTLTRDSEPMLLASVWAPGAKPEDRICVWIDPARYEG